MQGTYFNCNTCIDFHGIFLKGQEGPITIDCIEKYLEAAADCIICICDVLDIIEGGDGVCDSK